MVLEQLKDGAPRHLFDFSEGTRRLALILCLPLVDGVFATLLVTGAIRTFSDALAIALTIFTGAGALAVLFSHAESKKEARSMVLKVAPFLLSGAFLVSLVAPVFEQLFYLERLQYATGLALLVIASKMADIRFSDRLSVPAVIMTGMALSVRDLSALVFSLEYALPAVSTAAISVLGLYAASFAANYELDLRYIRRGGAAVLALIAASMYGVPVPSELGLAVFAASVAASARFRGS